MIRNDLFLWKASLLYTLQEWRQEMKFLMGPPGGEGLPARPSLTGSRERSTAICLLCSAKEKVEPEVPLLVFRAGGSRVGKPAEGRFLKHSLRTSPHTLTSAPTWPC